MLAFFAVLAITSCSPAPDKAQLVEEGENIFITNCAACHNETGEGFEEIPALAGNPFVTLENPAPVVDTVMNGRGSMPSFRGSLSDEEAAAVITYIRNAWGNSAPAVPPKQTR